MAPLIKVGGSLAAPKTDHLQLDHLAPLGSLSTMATGSLVTMHLVVGGWGGWDDNLRCLAHVLADGFAWAGGVG